jgi:hypothetical protein
MEQKEEIKKSIHNKNDIDYSLEKENEKKYEKNIGKYD